MTSSPGPDFENASAQNVVHGPNGLTIIGGNTVPPDSLTAFLSLFTDKCFPSFHDAWFDWGREEKEFCCDFLYALANTPEGRQAIVTALSTQSTIDNISNDMPFVLNGFIRKLPQETREQLILDEDDFAICGILAISDYDIIAQTIEGATDPDQKTKLITAYRWGAPLVIKCLDGLSPSHRTQCLKYENVIMSLGKAFFYDNLDRVEVEHALDRWGAHDLRRVLHYAESILSDSEIMFWTCLGLVMYTKKEMGDFQAPPLPPRPEEPHPSRRSSGIKIYPAKAKTENPVDDDDDWDIPF